MEFWEQLKSFLSYSFLDVSLQRVVLALFVFLLIYSLRQLFSKLGMKLLRKITGYTKTTFDDHIIDILEPPARFMFIIVGIWLAFEILELPETSKELIRHVNRSLFAIVIIWTAYRASEIVSQFIKHMSMKTESVLDDQLVLFVGKFLRVGIIAIGTMILVREWGYDIAGLVAGLGLGGLAFALAARDMVANLFGSITILMDRPFGIGDWIETPHVEGTVEDIRLRSTHVRTFANALVAVPNSVLANDAIINWSRMGKRRITFKLGVTYDSTRKQIEETVNKIKEMLKNHTDVHQKTIFVYFTDFGDSAVEIFLYFFTKTINWQEYLSVRQDVNLKIMEILEGMGMKIAFPSSSIYIEKPGPETQKHWDDFAKNMRASGKKNA